MEAQPELISHQHPADTSHATAANVSPPASTTAAWENRVTHVHAYLHLLGVRQDEPVRLLSERIRAHWEKRLQSQIEEDPSEVAIEEIQGALNDWLRAELNLPDTALHELLRARAAVLSGAVEGWVERWAGLSAASVAPAIRAALLCAVPEYAELPMPVQPIELRGVRLHRRLAALLHHIMKSFLKKH